MQKFTFTSTRFWLLAIMAAFLILGLIYSTVIPLFEPPDEVWHLAFADYLAKGGGLPVFLGTKSAFLREAGQPPLYYAVVALAIAPFDRSDFPTWVRFNASHPAVTRGATSDAPNVFIHTAREDWPWTGSVLAVHVARWVSLTFGALTVLGVYQIGRTVMERDDLALLSAALVAFTPEFVTICSSVNNDSLAAATSVWVGVAALQISNINYQLSKRYAVIAGIILGLGLLSKLGGLVLIPLIGLGFIMRTIRQRARLKFETLTPALAPALRLGASAGVWKLTFDGVIVVLVACLVSGWWFVRNILLYGDPLGWSVWLSDIGVRTPTPALWQLVPELPALFRTYWADLPGYPLNSLVYWALALVTLLSVTGIVRSLLSGLGRSTSPLKFDNWDLIFVSLWLVIVFAGVLRYMQTTPAAQGRLLFPALAPIGVLMVWGLSVLLRARWAWLPSIVVAGLFALALAAPFMLVRPAFAKPIVAQLPADVRPVQAQFGDRIELLGVQFPDQIQPGGALRVVTYWRALQGVPRDQRLLIRLMRPDRSSAGQLHAVMGTSLYPTSLWRPGQTVVDTHVVRVDADLPAMMMLDVQLGVGNELQPLLPVTGTAAWSTGDVAQVGQVQARR